MKTVFTEHKTDFAMVAHHASSIAGADQHPDKLRGGLTHDIGDHIGATKK